MRGHCVYQFRHTSTWLAIPVIPKAKTSDPARTAARGSIMWFTNRLGGIKRLRAGSLRRGCYIWTSRSFAPTALRMTRCLFFLLFYLKREERVVILSERA